MGYEATFLSPLFRSFFIKSDLDLLVAITIVCRAGLPALIVLHINTRECLDVAA